MKIPKTMVVQISSHSARRLYYQGHKICTSQDGYTTQEQAQQLTDPVNESWFQRNCIYGLVVPEPEASEIRKFQKQGLISMSIAGFTGILCMNFLMAYTMFKNYWCLGGFLALSYISVHYWVKIFENIHPNNNPYLKMMAKYGLSINDEE